MRWLLVMLLLTLGAWAQPGFTTNVSFEQGLLKVRFLNYEQPRGKPYLIAHFEIRNPGEEDQRCDWMSLCSLQKPDGTTMVSNYDVLVDSGNGMTRATGPFVVRPGRKATASLLFILGASDLPGQLMLPDGRLSAIITQRGKVP